MPYKNEAIQAQKSMKILKAIAVSSLLPFLAVILFFLIWNTVHVAIDGHITKDTMEIYIFLSIFFVFLFVYKKRNKFQFGESADYDIRVLDCQVWSIRREPIENTYSYYAAICTDTQFCNEYVAIQNYTYNCLVDNPDEQMLLVKVEYAANSSMNSKRPLFYLQTKNNLSNNKKRQLK